MQEPRNLPAVRPVPAVAAEVVEAHDLLPSEAELHTIQAIASLAAASKFFQGSQTAERAAMQILAGREYGLGPWQALSGMHVIEGKPTLSADTMHALVQRFLRRQKRGYFRVTVSSATRCQVDYQRPEWDAPATVVWTTEDAKAAGLLGKQNWRSYPRAMLRARAIAEAARAGFPDVCAGLYDPDELEYPELRPVSGGDAVAIAPIDRAADEEQARWQNASARLHAVGREKGLDHAAIKAFAVGHPDLPTLPASLKTWTTEEMARVREALAGLPDAPPVHPPPEPDEDDDDWTEEEEEEEEDGAEAPDEARDMTAEEQALAVWWERCEAIGPNPEYLALLAEAGTDPRRLAILVSTAPKAFDVKRRHNDAARRLRQAGKETFLVDEARAQRERDLSEIG